MNIKYEMTICDKCAEEEKVYSKLNELRKKLYLALRIKHNLPDNWVGVFHNNEWENVIEKEINIYKKQFEKKCIIFHDDESEMNLCEEHFKELLKGFEYTLDEFKIAMKKAGYTKFNILSFGQYDIKYEIIVQEIIPEENNPNWYKFWTILNKFNIECVQASPTQAYFNDLKFLELGSY